MKVAEIQQQIFEQTGYKTSVKMITGSMKYHLRISVMFQGGIYPKFDFNWRNEFIKQFKLVGQWGNFSNDHALDILKTNFEDLTPIIYKKESKPKQGKAREWGSENSQMRLDKASARYAKKLRGSNGDNMARYY